MMVDKAIERTARAGEDDARDKPSMMRDRSKPGHARVGYMELFFDLIFVFAVTQLSHRLLKDVGLVNALETTFLFFAVWWVWMFTTWVLNWLDPDNVRVRMMMFALSFIGLVMSASIPEAFAEKGLAFALTYVAAQVIRPAFAIYATNADPTLRRNFTRILIWFCFTAPLWIGGGLAEGGARWTLWLLALTIDYLGPWARFRVPGLGAASISDWNINGDHISERCALFIIIALGESLLVAGATFEKLPWDGPHWAALIAAVIATFAMWWIYFDKGLERGAHYISRSAEAGRIGRRVYTYIHALIVMGIIVCAVGDELILAHPRGHVEPSMLWTVAGGSLLYLVGCGLFKREIAGFFPLSHLVGVGLTLLATLGFWLAQGEPHSFAIACAAALVVTAVWEWRSLATGLPEEKRAA
jgi:low temperature requirement protein LtrA